MNEEIDMEKPTDGAWHVDPDPAIGLGSIWLVSNGECGGYLVASCPHQKGAGKANARLIAEAGTVYHETNLTPRQLAAQRDELLGAIRLTINENGNLADGDNCTLRHLVAAMSRAAAEDKEQALKEAAAIADKWATDEQRVHGLGGPEKAILALIDKKEGE